MGRRIRMKGVSLGGQKVRCTSKPISGRIPGKGRRRKRNTR